MLRVACPNCSKSLGLPDNSAGKSVQCPQCQQVFKAPAAPSAKPIAKPIQAAVPKKSSFEPEGATAYALKDDKLTPEHMKKSAQGQEIDAMVVNAQRTKIRNKAWDKVGTPAKLVKRLALTACILWVCAYLFMLMVIVLTNHNMEVAEKTGGMIDTGGVKSRPKYLFIQELFPELIPQNEATRPVFLWLYCSGALILALAIYGLQLAGAESMKKLEGYRLSLTSMIVGTLTLNLFCILGLSALMDKGVQYEFRVSQRRLEGKTGEELYNEGNEEDEDEDEDEEDEDEEEEEDQEEERPARRKR